MTHEDAPDALALPDRQFGSAQLSFLLLLITMMPREAAQPSARWPRAQITGTITDLRLDELSGLAQASQPDTFWTHNDSGDAPMLFRVDASLQILDAVRVRDVLAYDVEDIARGPCAPDDPTPCLYVADVGDNRHQRPHVHIWLLREADPAAALAVWHVAYPDGPRDAEALIVDPADATPYILDKRRDGRSQVWRVPRAGTNDAPATLAPVARLPDALAQQPSVSGRLVTAADVSPDGRCVAVRTYLDVWTLCAPPGQPLLNAFQAAADVMRPPAMLQSEALAWGADGALWITGEHVLTPLVRLPPP
jgi:hypothetical protein